MKRTYNIMLNIPRMVDATSWYRATGPLAHFRIRAPRFTWFMPMETSWAAAAPTDALFMQRPFHDDHKKIVGIYKTNMRKPLIVDYDDDLFNVPTDNPTNSTYGKKTNLENVRMILEAADVVMVSTKHLAEQYRKHNPNVYVVPNAFNNYLLPYRSPNPGPRNPSIVWRGSDTHQKDLMVFKDEIIEAANSDAARTWTWQFIGTNPWYVTDHMPHEKTLYCAPLDVMEYHELIYKIRPSLMVVPLHDNTFNRSKSNIAWIEASFAGAACLCPDWEEWRQPGALLYKNQKQFKEILMAVINKEIDVADQARKSWAAIQTYFTIEQTNELRRQCFARLLGADATELFEYPGFPKQSSMAKQLNEVLGAPNGP
jgi:hypothetical protein